jgi:hypothetical protein
MAETRGVNEASELAHDARHRERVRTRSERLFQQRHGGSTTGSSGSTGSTVDCNADEFGCVTIAANEPIKIGTLLSIGGDTAALGDDSNAGVTLGIDYLDGTLDGTAGESSATTYRREGRRWLQRRRQAAGR